MKIFLIKIGYFILFPIVLFLFLFVLLSVTNKYIAKTYQLNSETENVIIGDSRTQIFQDKKLRKTKNVALGSESYFYSYYKLKFLLKNNRQLKTVFLGASNHSFSDYFDEYIYEADVISNYFYILPLSKQLSILIHPAINKIQLIKKSTIKGFDNLIYSEKSFIGKSYIHTTNKELTENTIKDRIDFVYYNKTILREFSSLNKEYFEKIILLCREYKINLILLNTPTHSLYSSLIPNKFRAEYEKVVNRNSLEVITFDNLLEDSMFLPDGDHINKIGAEILSETLSKRIN
ncbi:MAG TPA: hypothetical protein DCG75_00170 [Bacteroidales bacterium]|nr:hypothetical protein [Bacteroidales bacterium]